ncbi:TRADD-N-associated membrane domain-containing protein [Amycolatopsis sp. lyj-109]|uniref:TRADD-N-associated membrane domain-containing protein n=1 Tax=Amycolatopsis sp. lyj-109 TaxID=2789287 RepID=UPI00397ADDDA
MKLKELRAATEFLVASGEIAKIRLAVCDTDGSPVSRAKLAALRGPLAKPMVSLARHQLKEAQNVTIDVIAADGEMTLRVYAYGRLDFTSVRGRPSGGQFEVKMLDLVRSLVEEIERAGLEELKNPIGATACWEPGAGLEMGEVDPVISTDVAAIDRRVRRLDKRRKLMRKAAGILALTSLMSFAFSVLLFVRYHLDSTWLLSLLYSVIFAGMGAWARFEAVDAFKDIEAVRGQQDLEQMLSTAVLERRAMKLFQVHSQQLRRYYDQALRQRGIIFLTGIFCILAGFAVVGVAFALLKSATPASSLEKILIATLGAIGGILGNFIAVVYLRMFTETIKSIGTFHDRLVATHHLHFANFLISKVKLDTDRDAALSLLSRLAAQEVLAGNVSGAGTSGNGSTPEVVVPAQR